MQVFNKLSNDSFMSRHDLIWEDIPYIWHDAPFLGNGFMGATFCFSKDLKRLFINIGHTCIYDNRPIEADGDDKIYLTPRLPIGKFSMNFRGTVNDVNLRLDIYNARLFGVIETSVGSVEIDCLIFNDADCLMLEHTEYGDEKTEIKYIPSIAQSPRYNAGIVDDEEAFAKYGAPKQAEIYSGNGVVTYVQPFYSYGGYCVSSISSGGRFFACVNYGDDKSKLVPDGAALLTKTVKNVNELVESHISWWHNYFNKSFVSINDGVYESFYYIQLYKLACASRENGRPFDTCGPWLSDTTRWPGTWWNLNVELSVSPLYTSNHIEIAHCVNNSFKKYFDDLINNVPEKYRKDCAALGRCTTSGLYSPITEIGNTDASNGEREAGNLIWALFYLWQEYKITGDDSIVEELVYPLLKRAVKYYSYFLTKDDNGRLHIPATVSPEYMKSDSPDVSYDISLLRWGCITLLEICEIFGYEDADKPEWNRILRNLTDLPQSEDEGIFIAANTPYAESHRHYSHLLSFYPLHILDENNKIDRKLCEKSLLYWQSKPEALLGYSQSGAASMYAMLGDGDKALRHLENLWKGFITPNTMYHEDGNPVIETPPSAATAILEMLVQSHRDYIDFFPALPSDWKNICFDGLLCQGGFEVSARITNGVLEWIKVKSNLGRCCVINADFKSEPEYCSVTYKKLLDGKLKLNLKAGETAVISTVPSPIIDCVPTPDKTKNCYGLNERNYMIYGNER